MCPFCPSWNLAGLLWPLWLLATMPVRTVAFPLLEIPGMGEKWWSLWKCPSEAPVVFVAPAVTSCWSHPMDMVFGKGVKAVLWPQAALFSWDILNKWKWGVVGRNWMFWPQCLSLIAELPHSQSSPTVSSACTKVLYFTDRSLTPFMVNIPKRWDSGVIISLEKRAGRQNR